MSNNIFSLNSSSSFSKANVGVGIITGIETRGVEVGVVTDTSSFSVLQATNPIVAKIMDNLINNLI